MMLTLNGLGADAAIAQVRSARPGTIETEAQAQWVRGGWGNLGNLGN